MHKKIKVFVIDDSIIARRFITSVMGGISSLEVVGSAANSKIALLKIPQVVPDVITIDTEQSYVNCDEILNQLRTDYPDIKVLVLGGCELQNKHSTYSIFESIEYNRLKRAKDIDTEFEIFIRFSTQLEKKINCLMNGQVEEVNPDMALSTKTAEIESFPEKYGAKKIDLIVIGSSTGGPDVLVDIFSAMQHVSLPPILIVQHMPPVFTGLLAERLNKCGSSITFYEGKDNQNIESGCGYIAPGDFHMQVSGNGVSRKIHLNQKEAENSCRPSVDVLFQSAVQAVGGNILTFILTGMGRDGLMGCRLIKSQGGKIYVQNKESSIVWGMAGAVWSDGLAEDTLTPCEISNLLNEVSMKNSFGIRKDSGYTQRKEKRHAFVK